MPKKPETIFKEKVLEELREMKNSYWIKIQQLSIRGIPDIIGVVNGRFVALELKKSHQEKADKLQEYVLEEVDKAGGIALVTNPENFEEVKGYITKQTSF
jgi:pantothenate kinase|tara:strand:- start:895 stop:1194 length:300 start_codon:yes stop_codon:yes gene_type:complete